MKTAVETLFEKLEMLKMKLNFKQIDSTKYYSDVKKAYKDCLEKERTQIIQAFDAGYNCSGYEVNLKGDWSSEIYYSKTFKSKEL